MPFYWISRPNNCSELPGNACRHSINGKWKDTAMAWGFSKWIGLLMDPFPLLLRNADSQEQSTWGIALRKFLPASLESGAENKIRLHLSFSHSKACSIPHVRQRISK